MRPWDLLYQSKTLIIIITLLITQHDSLQIDVNFNDLGEWDKRVFNYELIWNIKSLEKPAGKIKNIFCNVVFN